eukprot:Skav206122  [mRNA]  locus=scaffold172:204714:221930:+ [translate_table: standard]
MPYAIALAQKKVLDKASRKVNERLGVAEEGDRQQFILEELHALAMQFTVTLLSGRSASVEASSVPELLQKAQKELQLRIHRFITQAGLVQDKLRDIVDIAMTSSAFAAVSADGSCILWGRASAGGRCEQLLDVQRIVASRSAFAAIRRDGQVVSWGALDGIRQQQDQLYDVVDVCASESAFCAWRLDGRAVTWGSRGTGGDSLAVQNQLRNPRERRGERRGGGVMPWWWKVTLTWDEDMVPSRQIYTTQAMLYSRRQKPRKKLVAMESRGTPPFGHAKRHSEKIEDGSLDFLVLENDLQTAIEVKFSEEIKVIYPKLCHRFHISDETAEMVMQVSLRDAPSISGTCQILPSACTTLRVSESFGSFGPHAADYLQKEQEEVEREQESRNRRKDKLQNELEEKRQEGARTASICFAFLGFFGSICLVVCGVWVEPEESAVDLTLVLGFLMCWVGCCCTLTAAAGFNFTSSARCLVRHGSLAWIVLCCLSLAAGAVRYADFWWIALTPGLICCCCLILVCLAVHRPDCFQTAVDLKEDVEWSIVFHGSVDLQDVQQLAATSGAFAAICGSSRRVVTWGSKSYGGDAGKVEETRRKGTEQLVDIDSLCSTHFAFAALRSDGQILCWGNPLHGGEHGGTPLQDVQQLVGSYGAFHALRGDGWIISWGSADSGGTEQHFRQSGRVSKGGEGVQLERRDILYARSAEEILVLLNDEVEAFDLVRTFLADSSLPRARPRHIANAFWSFSQLQKADAPLLDLLAFVALETIDSFEAQSLASCTWAMAKLVDFSQRSALWSALRRRSMALISEFDARGLSNTAWACATMRQTDPLLLEALGHVAVAKMSEFDEQALSTTMWASAKLVWHQQVLVDAMVMEVIHRDLHQQGLANISWSCATLRIGDPALLATLTRLIGQFGAQNLGNLAWTLAKLLIEDAPLMLAISAMTCQKIRACGHQEIGNVAWAFATLGLRNLPLLESLAAEAMERMAHFNVQGVANTAWALAKVSYHNMPFFHRVATRALETMPVWDPQAIANLSWAYATIAFLHEPLMAAISERAVFEPMLLCA